MKHRTRLTQLEKRLGLDAGPRVKCQCCNGTGSVYPVDGAYVAWLAAARFAEVTVELGGEPQPLPPKPVEQLVTCRACQGVGMLSAYRQERMRNPKGGLRLADQLARAVDGLRRQGI